MNLSEIEPQAVLIALITAGATYLLAWATLRKGSGENKNRAEELKNQLNAQIDARVKSELLGAYADIDDLKSKVAALEEKNEALEVSHRSDKRTIIEVVDLAQEMAEHIEEIEALVPTPPGVPSRPDWLSRINGLGLA